MSRRPKSVALTGRLCVQSGVCRAHRLVAIVGKADAPASYGAAVRDSKQTSHDQILYVRNHYPATEGVEPSSVICWPSASRSCIMAMTEVGSSNARECAPAAGPSNRRVLLFSAI